MPSRFFMLVYIALFCCFLISFCLVVSLQEYLPLANTLIFFGENLHKDLLLGFCAQSLLRREILEFKWLITL